MRVPFVDVQARLRGMGREVEDALLEVAGSGRFILGPAVDEFEKAWAEYVGANFAVGVGSGFDALELALRAHGIGQGTVVIVPAHTFSATGLAVMAAGATPLFVDVDPETLCVDVEQLEAAAPVAEAVIPVHMAGRTADMISIMSVARRHGLVVVEDAAQAHGARYHGTHVGTMGDLGAFSFYPSKNMGALGDAGIVVTDNPDLAAKLRRLRNQGQEEKYEHDVFGVNSRMDAIHAAALLQQLPHLDSWNERRRHVASIYRGGLAGIEDLSFQPAPGRGDDHVYHLFQVFTPPRDELRAHLAERGVETGIHYPTPLHLQGAYRIEGDPKLPVSEWVSATNLSLPMYPEIGDDQVDYVVERVKEFFAS